MAEELTIVIQARNEAERELAKVKKEVRGLGDEAGTGNKKLSGLSKTLRTGVTAAALGATTAIAGAGVALGGVIGSSVKAAATMEEQVSGIAAVMGASGDDIERINDLILDLGVNPNLKVSATEAADAIELLARNGVSLAEIEGEMAEATVLLANAAGSDFGTAADIATDAMANFEDSIDSGKGAVDGIASVLTSSKFDINDYNLAMAQAGGTAGALGVDFNDFNTTLSATASLFASGSDAGTSMKNFLTRLVPSTNPAKESMAELGLATVNTEAAFKQLRDRGLDPTGYSFEQAMDALKEFHAEEQGLDASTREAKQAFQAFAQETGIMESAFFDAQGNMKSMAEISGALQEATKDLSEEQKAQHLQTIFGNDAMRTAIGLAETGEDEFRALQEQMGETDALVSAQTRMDNFAGAMEILQGIIETIQLEIGAAFLPILTDLTNRLSDFVSNNADAIVAFFENFALGIENTVALVEGLVSAFTTEGATLEEKLANIGELFLNLIPQSAYENIRNFIGIFNSSADELTPFQNKISALADNHISKLQGAFSEAAEGLGPLQEAFQGLIDSVGPLVTELSEVIIPVLGAAIGIALNAFEAAIPAIVDLMTILVDQMASSVELITSLVSGLRDLVVGIFTGDFEMATNGATEIFNGFSTYIGDTVANLWEVIKLNFQFVFDFITNVMTDIGVLSEDSLGSIQTFWNDTMESIKLFVEAMALSVQGSINTVTSVFNTLNNLVATVTTAIEDAWDAVANTIEAGVEIMNEAIDALIAGFESLLDPINSVISALEDMWDWLNQGIPDWVPGFGGGGGESEGSSIPGWVPGFGASSSGGSVSASSIPLTPSVAPVGIPIAIPSASSGNSVTLNVREMTVRSDGDIKKITDTIMQELNRRQRVNTI